MITYYRSGWLIDGSGSPAVENVVFCVKDKFFHKILKLYSNKLISKHVVDMSDYTVLPCFVDAHVHLAFSGTTDFALRKEQLKKNCENRKDIIANNMMQHLLSGVVAVRDAGDPNNDVLKFKHFFLGTNLARLKVFSSGMAWHANGRYGKFIGESLEPEKTLAQSVYIKGNLKDQIKIINSGLNSLRDFNVETSPQFKADEIKVAIDVAKIFGKKVMIHANGYMPVRLALDARCDSIEHGFFMGESNLTLMAQNSIAWVPTVFTMKACALNSHKNLSCNDALIDYISSKNLEHQLGQLVIAKKNGVTVALGTDAGSPGINHGSSVKDELKLLVESGYTIEQAVCCATKNGAQLVGCSDIGLIAEGMKANFIAIKAKPHDILTALEYPDFVFVEGEEISF